jgi:hypothetical protein
LIMLVQVFALLGALMILAAFAGSQFRWMSATGLVYLWLNTIGAAVLSVTAWLEQQWGFLLLEGVWTLVSLYALLRLLRSGPVPDRT